MEFDKSRVYTSVNADELKVGSKIIVADNIEDLQDRVEDDWTAETLTAINSISHKDRFKVRDAKIGHNLAYLVSEPEDNGVKWTDLKIGDVIKHKTQGIIGMVVGISPNEERHINVLDMWLDDQNLLLWEKLEKEAPTEPRQRTYPTLSDDLYKEEPKYKSRVSVPKDKVEPKPVVSD